MIGLFVAVAARAAEIELPAGPLVQGTPVEVRASGATVLDVTYKPGSELSHTETVALGPEGSGTWVPQQPGVVVLTAGDATRRVSVRFASVPWSGVAVFTIASTLLFGGMGLALARLMQSRDEGLPIQIPTKDT